MADTNEGPETRDRAKCLLLGERVGQMGANHWPNDDPSGCLQCFITNTWAGVPTGIRTPVDTARYCRSIAYMFSLREQTVVASVNTQVVASPVANAPANSKNSSNGTIPRQNAASTSEGVIRLFCS